VNNVAGGNYASLVSNYIISPVNVNELYNFDIAVVDEYYLPCALFNDFRIILQPLSENGQPKGYQGESFTTLLKDKKSGPQALEARK